MTTTAVRPQPAAAPLVPRSARVAARRQETHDTVTLTAQPADGSGFRFRPGQFTMLYAFGAGEVPISISGDPLVGGRFEVTIRAVGAATRRLTALQPGAVLGVRGPYGSDWPLTAAAARDVVVVAGGIGLAPLRPLLYRLAAERTRHGRVTLLYGARTPEDLLYVEQLQAWRANGDLDLHLTVDAAARGWQGHVGVVTALLRDAELGPATVAYVCGPEVMMRFTALELLRRELSPQRVFVSLERNMKCAVGLCGHCQLGAEFLCTAGPIHAFDRVAPLLAVREL